MAYCPLCFSAGFDPARALFSEKGPACDACHRDIDSTPYYYDESGGVTGEDVAINVAGALVGAVTGIGFRRRRSSEPVPIPPEVRERMLQTKLAVRRRVAPAANIRLRRGEQEFGSYTLAQLKELWDAGRVGATDEYWYQGMDAWRSVTEFVPPPA
jgi:hypothetical protein